MNGEMTKERLLGLERAARQEWEALLDQVGEARMTVPAINNGWSLKDAVAHISYYEGWLLNWLEAAVRGQVTAATHRDLLGVDERNALVFAENRGRPLSEVLADSRRIHYRLVQVVELLTEHDLFSPHRYERYIAPFWESSRPLWQCLPGDSYAHYQEHSASVRAWLAQQTEHPTPRNEENGSHRAVDEISRQPLTRT